MAPIDKQDINISEVKDYNLNTSVEKIDTPDIFLNRLNNYNITDLSQVLIKKDGEMFIFNINGNDEFCVFGEKKFQDFVKNFYENKENNEKSIVVELNQLRLSILSGTAPSLREESDRQQELLNNATDINVIKNRITLLHDFYDAQLDDSRWNAFFLNTKYTAQEKASWKINKTEAKKRLKMIENIQDKIEQIEK
ncbi:TPA: hypothetical protein DEP21_01505 [Patescibacteria group bacterium]|nr:hypothetical protein [Candidatus Gracilibacteria bacterium]